MLKISQSRGNYIRPLKKNDGHAANFIIKNTIEKYQITEKYVE